MNERVQRLRKQSVETVPSLCAERALILTEVYREQLGKHPTVVLRALALRELCAQKILYLDPDEPIVGERGPEPKATPTYPELTCHSLDDLRLLSSREKTRYRVSETVLQAYEQKIIPFWEGRSLRDRLFQTLGKDWQACYQAGVFTEFMEQRAPGHTTLDGKIYQKGLLDFQQDIAVRIAALDFLSDPGATPKREQLLAMHLACQALMLLASRYAEKARALAASEPDQTRQRELFELAAICARVPAQAPRTFREAIQMYWFVHLGVILELNGWDAFNPGHLDQHLYPFYARERQAGTLTREQAKELLCCLWVKFNNQPAPPKVGVTAAESGTYNDFVNINLGGLLLDGEDGVCELSYLLLEVIEEMHLLQPGSNVQLSQKTPEAFLKAACRVIRKGYGYPALFNADGVVAQMLRVGKSLPDARGGGTSGCVETGCFGKEAYILTGYFNLPKILELTLNDGQDPRTGLALGPRTGAPQAFAGFEALLAAFATQLVHFVDIKLRGNAQIESMVAEAIPAPFLSVLIDDCIANGRDYNAGGARYNTSYLQGVGIGTITDSLSAIAHHVFEKRALTLDALLAALRVDFAGEEALRLCLANKTPRYGNDEEAADRLMRRVFDLFFEAVEGRPNLRGGTYHIDMLPTTCHLYFGSVLGATPDGRRAGKPLSEGISPVQGADRLGPTAVLQSAARMDHARTGGTLLNQKFLPRVLAGEAGIDRLAQLVRTYFRLGGHHLQFNVVDAATLEHARAFPQEHRDLIVRVAGYSDYYCDLGRELQDEILARTAHQDF